MKMNGQVFSKSEQDLIHSKSIDILENVGVSFPDEGVLAMLEQNGAQIDWDKQVAKITGAMVTQALTTAPKAFTLGARNPAHDFALPSAYSALNLDGTGVYALDPTTGDKRNGILQDISNAAKVFETVPMGKVLWPPIVASDCPAGTRNLMGAATSMIHCSKHIQDEVKDVKEIPFLLGLLSAILGSEDAIRDRKIYSVTYCTIAPLMHDKDMMLANMELAKRSVPILVYPMPACGSTGPVSLYSNVAMANAEALSAIVLFQLTNPGTPLIFGTAQGIIHRKTGLFLEGAPETVLQGVAMTEMGKRYGLPTTIAGCLSDAKEPGMQAVLEKVLTTLPLCLAGTDVIQGIGLLESSMTLSLEQILIDAEIAGLCQRMRDGIEVSPEKDFYEDIVQVQQGGHFLKQPSTRAGFRSNEFYTPSLLDRDSYDEWSALGSPNMFTEANKKVRGILTAEPENPLPLDVEKQIREIMEEMRRQG
jgi:trimethylamine---corrinoid protein Co-methyltransferase